MFVDSPLMLRVPDAWPKSESAARSEGRRLITLNRADVGPSLRKTVAVDPFRPLSLRAGNGSSCPIPAIGRCQPRRPRRVETGPNTSLPKLAYVIPAFSSCSREQASRAQCSESCPWTPHSRRVHRGNGDLGCLAAAFANLRNEVLARSFSISVVVLPTGPR